jgi:hypothetical protein
MLLVYMRYVQLTRDKPIFSSEGILHKDYYRKGSGVKKKIFGLDPQGVWRQYKLIGGRTPVVKYYYYS